MIKWKQTLFFVLVVAFLTSTVAGVQVGTSFTYQGKLHDAGQAANGAYDFELAVYDDPGSASPLETLSFCSVDLRDGIFTLNVDFGPVFDGERRWLEVGVTLAGDCDGSTIYTFLDPRQEITASPHSVWTIEALNAERLDGLDSTAFLRSTGTAVAENIVLTGTLMLDPGAALIFSDGSVQTTAAFPLGPTVTHPEIHLPAFLTCGDAAENDPAQWAPLAIGTFRLPLDGSFFDIPTNFAGIDVGQGMGSVAARIQTAIRAVTGGQETVIWNGRFIIHSVLATSQSSIAPLESTGFPVDISGAGSSAWMDCETGRGTPKEAVLNLPVYEGHVPLLDENGQLDANFRPPAIRIGVDSFNPISLASAKTVVHNLGRIPSRIRIWWHVDSLVSSNRLLGEGVYDGSSYATLTNVVASTFGNTQTTVMSTTSMIIVGKSQFSNGGWSAVIGENSENHFRIDIVQFDGLSNSIDFGWEVQ